MGSESDVVIRTMVPEDYDGAYAVWRQTHGFALRSLDERAVQAFRFDGVACARERRPIAFPAISVQCELRHDEHFSSDIGKRRSRMLFSVGKDSQLVNLGPQLLNLGLSVVLPDAKQDEKSPSARSGDRSSNRNACLRHSLHDCFHVGLPISRFENLARL